MTTNVVETESTRAVVTDNPVTNIVEVTSAGPAGPAGSLTIQDQGVSEGLLTDKINFAGSTVSVVNDTVNEIATVTVNAATPGANTNITSLGGITGGISSPDFIQFDTAAAATGAVGRMLWNDTDGTLEFQLKGGNVTLQVGQEQVLRVTNQSGATMVDGQVVYITGSTGNHLNVTLSQANSEMTSSKTLAVVTETIANNQSGFATTSGLVRNFNTSALTEGEAIWLSPTVPGGLTSTKPVAPNHAVLIGWCVRQHASVGVIYVHIANGYELQELHNVLITAVANNQVLRYDSATSLWKNATISPTVTLTGAVTGSGTMTDLGSVSIATTATADPTLTLAGDATGSATFTNLGDATLTVTVVDDSHNHIISNVDGLQDALDSKLAAADYTAADVLTKIKTVDGAGSGLDADLLDGQSSAYYTAINDRLGYTAENAANKGIAGGYASLDGAGLVPSTQLPSYVDDVLEYANLAAFPATGVSGVIYVAIDTSKTYRWTGSVYVEISASPGTTDSLTEGSVNLYFTTARARQSVSAGTGISYDNSTGVITNSSPDQTVALTAGTGISTSGTYPNFTITNSAPDQTVALTAGTGISTSGAYPNFTITNSAPDQTVALTGSGTTSISGTYPNFTISSADQYVGTVTSVSGTGTVSGLTLSGSVTSSGSLTLGGTLSLTSGNVTTALGYTPANKAGDTFTGNVLVNSGADSRVQVQSNGTTVVQLQATASEARLHGVGAIPVSLWSNGVKIIEASTSQVTINNRPLVSTNTITGSQFNGSAAGLTGIKTVNGTSILGSGNIPVGVTQIVAGTNVTISPVGGTGIVTINASGGGGGGSPATPAVAGIVYGRTNNNTCSPTFATSLGFQAGAICQGSNSIAIGGYAGLSYQSCSAVAVGSQAGNWQQSWAAVAVGPYAGNCLQGAGSIAIGNQAGFVTQGCTAVAIGFNAGSYSQLADAVAIGSSAGNFNQGYQAVAIGSGAGVCLQSSRAVAIGHAAGGVSQGVNSVAIGAYAGDISMPANSIAINATGASLTPTGVSQTHMAPIRNATTAYHLYYDPTTKEITYG